MTEMQMTDKEIRESWRFKTEPPRRHLHTLADLNLVTVKEMREKLMELGLPDVPQVGTSGSKKQKKAKEKPTADSAKKISKEDAEALQELLDTKSVSASIDASAETRMSVTALEDLFISIANKYPNAKVTAFGSEIVGAEVHINYDATGNVTGEIVDLV